MKINRISRAALFPAVFAAGVFNLSGDTVMSKADMIRSAIADSLIPVRPGGVNGQAFWNTYALSFIYAPVFDFKEVPGAASYFFTAVDRFGERRCFSASSPHAALSPVWAQLPPGPVFLTVDALDPSGRKIAVSGTRSFYRNAPFTGCYPPKTCSYAECARKAYAYFFKFKYVQDMAQGRPDYTYSLFCYPSKMHAAIINGMVNHAEMIPEQKETALAVARGSAAHLMKNAVPAGKKLEYLPLTYENDPGKAGAGVNTIMMLYPAGVGSAMLNLFKATGDRQYLDYAVRIGEQYLRLQQPNGTWHLALSIKDGSPAGKNYAVPTSVMIFLEKLAQTTGDAKYRKAAEKGIPYIKNMLRSFNWEGQFEDVELMQKPYQNLTKHNGTDIVFYLAKRTPDDPELRGYARELQRFSEDQFVVWEQPGWMYKFHIPGFRPLEATRTKKWGWYNWTTPAVLEQYRCFVPVDASLAKMIRYYLFLYDLEKNPMDLAKARALGDAVTRIQGPDGRIPTWCDLSRPVEQDWINCGFATASALKLLATYDRIR